MKRHVRGLKVTQRYAEGSLNALGICRLSDDGEGLEGGLFRGGRGGT